MTVLLCNQHLDVVQCSVISSVCPNSSVKLGNGWEYFCKVGGFQLGDHLRFKFGGPLSANLIHVMKIGTIN
jgi:hypothetical protein